VNVYVIDTGINIEHEQFEGRAIWGYTARPGYPNTDDNGHGTFVASVIGGKDFGVAKKVTLIAVKALGSDGSGSISGIIAGVDWTGKNHQESGGNLAVGAFALFGGSTMRTLNEALDKSSLAGVFMVGAGGNFNSDACLATPSSAQYVVAVAASTTAEKENSQELEDVRAPFSSFGKCIHVFAPGVLVQGAWVGSRTAVRTISGTSPSTAFASGVGALILSENSQNNWSFIDFRKKIQDLATPNLINLKCPVNPACQETPNLLLYNGC